MTEESTYSPAETERGLRFGIVDGVFSYAMFTLSSGAILAALALFAGMGDFEFGMLAALPFLSQLLQLPGVVLMRRYQNRKAVCIAFATAGRLSLLGISLSVLFLAGDARRIGIFAAMIAWSAFGALAAGAWLWWMRDLVPEERLGRYFGTRGAVLLGLSAPVLLGAGLFLDTARAPGGPVTEAAAFAILYAVAAGFGIMSSVFLTLIPHRPPREDPTTLPLREAFTAPFAQPNFRRLLSYITLWGFGATLTGPFFAVFLLVDLRLPIFVVTVMLVVGIATNMIFFWMWGRLSDRLGNKPVLAACVPVFAAGLLLILFIPADGGVAEFALIALVQVLLSVGTAGADLTSWNLAFKLGKGPAAPNFLAGTLLVRALSTGIGPILGGSLGALFVGRAVTVVLPVGSGVPLVTVAHLEFVFLLGAALILLSARPLSKVREEGEASRSDLMAALRIEAGSDALFPVVRHFALASAFLVRAVVKGDEFARGAIHHRRRGDNQ